MVTKYCRGGTPPPTVNLKISKISILYISELSVIEKDFGFVQTRDQELPIALFKSIKLQLTRKLELTYIFFKSKKCPEFL